MSLPKFLHVGDCDRNVSSDSMETWINIDEIARISIACSLTPVVNIYFRSSPDQHVLVKGDDATRLITMLRSVKE